MKRTAIRVYSWFEENLALWALLSIGVASIGLVGNGLIKIYGVFGASPLTFAWNSSDARAVLIILAFMGCSLAGNVLSAYVFGEYGVPGVVRVTAPWVFLAAAGLGAIWIYESPPAGSNPWPLTILLVGVAAMWWLIHFGPLSRWKHARVRAGNNARASADEGGGNARVTRPKATFASIFGNEAIKQRLGEAARAITAPRPQGQKPRNGILLHGKPGNGKTVFAEALAGELGLPLISLSYADVASQWVGEKSARVRQAFEQARRAQPCVLFLDEVDSFIEARDGRSDGVKEDRDLTNALLTLMVDIRESRVILVAATNHMDRLDAAAVREGRFDFKVEITPPDGLARLGLLRKGLADNMPGFHTDESVLQAVAARWNGFSVKRILAVTEELPSYLKGQGARRSITFDDFMGALRQLQGQRGAQPENVKPLAELLLAPETREALDLIAGRMADPEHTEKHGGTLPTGVLFSGPPGTGKTATAKALAAELGWGFLPSTGAELARDPRKLQSLFDKATDLRPAIIFVDEADELLRSREYSPNTEATNKLLTIMDGVGDRVRDVVWVAATNHPDQIDPALLRGGRFTEKVRFQLPDAAILNRFVRDWLAKRGVQLEDGLESGEVAAAMGEQSIANADAIVQAALNRAVSRRVTPVVLTRADVDHGLRSVAH